MICDATKWDLRFLDLAKLISTWSYDPSTKCGAVIVRSDKTIASVGYNGFPKFMPDKMEHYENREEKYSRIVHAEMNALLHANEKMTGHILYIYPFLPCDRCFVHMVQAGIEQFVAPICPEDKLERWGAAFEKVKQYANECGVDIFEIEYK